MHTEPTLTLTAATDLLTLPPGGISTAILMEQQQPVHWSPSTIHMVAEFRAAYALPVRQEPTMPDPERFKLHYDMIAEELREFREASGIVGVADALIDLAYLVDSALLEFGLGALKDKLFAEVHRSNMSKLGEDGKPVYWENGKVKKGPNYDPPDLASIIGAAMSVGG